MKKNLVLVSLILVNTLLFPLARAEEDEAGQKTKVYFEELFSRLKSVADQDPAIDNFRELMRPVAEKTEGFFGASLIDPDFIIRQVYHPSHFLARGYDLKGVKELIDFYKKMKERPAPQLSEPAHGSILQPRLIALRYPVIREGRLINIVSMMVRTDAFLKATGLDKGQAFKIICLGKLAEEKGKLSKNYKEFTLSLPATEWVIQYEE